MNAQTPDASWKEGLQAAVDVTKFTLNVAGAAIAFLLASDTLSHAGRSSGKMLITGALLGFASSAVGGILVLLEAGQKLSRADYDLSDPFIRLPGQVNILGLALGFVCASVLELQIIWAR